jgi:hypothetical protein
MRRCSPSSAQLARSGHACTRRPYPGVLREVLLARIAGDVAGALSLPLLRRKGDLGTGHAAAGPALSRAIPYHAYWKGDLTHPAFVSGSATLDHVVPIADSSNPLERSNLVTACSGCNRRKGDLRLEEIGWSLIEPADPGWMVLTDLYFRLWQAAVAVILVDAPLPAGRVGNDDEQVLLDRIHQKVDLGQHLAHGVRHFKGNPVPWPKGYKLITSIDRFANEP